MGFLKDLQKVGLGNKGPHGNLRSGASNYVDYSNIRANVESNRGISQALAGLARDGKTINMKDMAELSDKWGVPLPEVMIQAKPMNEQNRATYVKQKMKTLSEMYMNLTPEERKGLDGNGVMKMFQKAGVADDPEIMKISQDVLSRFKEKNQTVALGQGESLLNLSTPIGGGPPKVTPLAESPPKKKDAKPVKAYIRPDGKIQHLANNVTPPVGWKPYSEKSGKESKAEVWILPNLESRRSFDGGRTYIGKDGRNYTMPREGAYKARTQFTGTEIAALKSRKQAGEAAKNAPVQGGTVSAKATAEAGTGVYANLGAATDAVLGGLGVDALFGKDGFFKDTQDARQKLRIIKQLGKSAFMNSSRGAIWEQQKIDKLFPDPNKWFANPRTESRKIASLREALLTEKQFNNQAIAESVDPKEISRLRKSNIDIDRLMAHIGGGESGEDISDDELIQKYLQ